MTIIEPVVKRIDQSDILRYADAVGDHNPIHIDEAFAKATPFEGTIAHGMLVLATISEMMARAFGERWLASGRLKVRFKSPARPGDTLTTRAEPRGSRREGDAEVVEYAVECLNQRDETLISGSAELRLPPEEP